MSTLVGVVALLSLFAAGVCAGWRFATTSRDIDEHAARFLRDADINDQADMGEQR